MPHRRTRTARALSSLALVAGLGACTTFSAARPADVDLGSSWHLKAGLGAPTDPAVSWFSSITEDCILCRAYPVPQSEIGWQHGWRGAGGRKYSAGLYLDGIVPQVDAYAQLRESAATNWGVGARAGMISATTGSAKIYLLHDRSLGGRKRLLLNPGLYWYGGVRDTRDDECCGTHAWMAGVTQTVGFEYDLGDIVWTPQLTLVGVHGELGGDAAYLGTGQRRHKFDDVFVTAAIGLAFRGKRR